ncbi:MAG: lytic transglycosylase domain-containing protein [Magnetococcales bacterium]|nr:lytic transglycosylase domain-containing protein [Magnetococcales bacterium]
MSLMSMTELARFAETPKDNQPKVGSMGRLSRFQDMLDQAMVNGQGMYEDDGKLPILHRHLVNQLSTAMRSAVMRAEQLWQGSAFAHMNSAKETSNTGAQNSSPVHGSDYPFSDMIRKASMEHGIKEHLLRAVVEVQSNFDPNATTADGAKGLVPLQPETAQALGVTDLNSAEQNVNAGANYLSQLLNRYQGEEDLSLAALNWGVKNLEQRPGEIPYDTRNFLGRVTKLMDQYSAA